MDIISPICQFTKASALDPETLVREAAGAEVILLKGMGRVSREVMEAAPDLKVIGRQGVGVDNIDLEAARARGLRVINSPHGNTLAVAEHFIMLALGLSRKLTILNGWLRRGDWSGLPDYAATEMTGRTLGILGFGHIGQLVAKICSTAFGMPVIYASRAAHEETAFILGAGRVKTEELFERADYLAICQALTPDTRHLVDQSLISRMKPSAFLINLARGGVWKEADVLAALRSGAIAGAASDVYEVEPAGADHPLFACDNFFGTPHTAGLTAEANLRIDLEVVQGVLDVLEGREPAQAVV
jgi:Lactate dehydrogenase and related dehydrogenases